MSGGLINDKAYRTAGAQIGDSLVLVAYLLILATVLLSPTESTDQEINGKSHKAVNAS